MSREERRRERWNRAVEKAGRGLIDMGVPPPVPVGTKELRAIRDMANDPHGLWCNGYAQGRDDARKGLVSLITSRRQGLDTDDPYECGKEMAFLTILQHLTGEPRGPIIINTPKSRGAS